MALTQPSAEGALRDAQRWLFQRVTQPSRALQPAPFDEARWVVSGSWSSSERVAVYRRAYFSRLVACLLDDFPALAHAVGVGFEPLCLEFIDAHPPTSPTLNSYGAPFADFCASRPLPQAAFLSELARFEWAIVECIHAGAERSLDAHALNALSQHDWPRARLILSSAARVLTASFPVHAYHRAVLAGDAPAAPPLEPCTIVVSRRGDDVWRFRVSAELCGLLRRLVDGEPLAGALDAIPADALGAQTAAELQRAMSEWVECGLFVGVDVGGPGGR